MERCSPLLSLQERRKIDNGREAKIPVLEVADRLGRAPSTICRESKRSFFDDKDLPGLNGYRAMTAQVLSEKRRGERPELCVSGPVNAGYRYAHALKRPSNIGAHRMRAANPFWT